MSAYNPYACNRYESILNSSNKSVNGSKQSVRKVQPHFYKMIFVAVVIALIVTSFFLIRTTAATSVPDVPMEGETLVTVSAGDSLWSIAGRHYESTEDTGYAVFLIKERNQMDSNIIKPGDQLIIPLIP